LVLAERELIDESALADPPDKAPEPAQPITMHVAPEIPGSVAVAL
jgi:hypothetical protein